MFDNYPQKTATPVDARGDASRWIAPVALWSVWQEDASTKGLPDVQFIESALRRKLSLLAKMSLKVAYDCAGSLPSVRMVYASRHGDLTRTTAMLVDLADGEMLSPTAFSMSVLNASAGVYSISKQDHAPSTAVSAAQSSFGFGLLEACLQLASNPDSPVLFVYADETPPALYGISSGAAFVPHAIGLLLTNGAATEIACQMECTENIPSLLSQSQTFLRCLDSGEAAVWHGEGRTWSWCRHARQN